ncbi:hypothetical protein FRC07_009675 [Ceratobasidium sp. 392]|nr:hypothetical protein FRC07_009675 [Ceratobasidium sp. 392]
MKHDRLQLAVLYIDYEKAKLSSINWDLDWLKRKEAEEKGRIVKHQQEIMEAEAQDNTDGRKGLLKRLAREDQRTKEDLKFTKERINLALTARNQAEKSLAYRPKLLELIQELYSSAFDGETPGELDSLVRSPYNRRNIPKLERDARLSLLEQNCRNFLESYQALVHEIDEHLNTPTRCPLSSISRIEDPEAFLRVMRTAVLPPVQPQDPAKILRNIADQLKAFALSLKDARRIDEERRNEAKRNLDAAHIMLDLRTHQLAETRRQILDHIIDPANCPLNDPMVHLPQYPDEDGPNNASSLRRRLEEAEAVSKDKCLEQIIQNRLNRARRGSYPPVVVPERYTPPGYSDTKGIAAVQRHSTGELEGTEVTEIPREYESYLTLSCNADETVYGVLGDLTARARKDLLPVVNANEAFD